MMQPQPSAWQTWQVHTLRTGSSLQGKGCHSWRQHLHGHAGDNSSVCGRPGNPCSMALRLLNLPAISTLFNAGPSSPFQPYQAPCSHLLREGLLWQCGPNQFWSDLPHTPADAQLQVQHEVVASVALVDCFSWSLLPLQAATEPDFVCACSPYICTPHS